MKHNSVCLGLLTALLCCTTADAAVLKSVKASGEGLSARVIVEADDQMTYLVKMKDSTHWTVDIAKTDLGELPSTVPLTIPAASSVDLEKRKLGKIDVVRLTVTVRPNVEMSVKPSSDRKTLSLSFASAAAPAEDKLLDELDAPASASAAKFSDDLDAPAAPAAAATIPAATDAAVAVAPKPVSAAKIADDLDLPDTDKGLPVKVAADSKPAETLKSEVAKTDTKTASSGTEVKAPAPIEAKTILLQKADSGALRADELDVAPPVPAVAATVHEADKHQAEAEVVSSNTEPSVTVNGSTVEITTPGMTSYKSFTLFSPTRVVIDIFGAKANLTQMLSKIKISGVKAVRSSQHTEKVRVVFDMSTDDVPSFGVTKSGSGVRVTFREN